MSGICGIVAHPNQIGSVTDERLRRMAGQQLHRGDDLSGLWIGRAAGLCCQHHPADGLQGAHARGRDVRFRIAFDGSIEAGASFDGSRLEESLPRLLGAGGSVSLSTLRGAFAFAVWDDAERRLMLVRDRLGARPLYYAHGADGTLFFASEIKALLAAEAVRPALNYAALPDYLATGTSTGEATLFDGVRRVPPGHALIWQDGHVRMERYWRLSFRSADTAADDGVLVDRFSALFRRAVRHEASAEGPVGAILTGGIGSVAVTALLQDALAEPASTFSVAFGNENGNGNGNGNGSGLARLAALSYGTNHHETVVTADDFLASLPHIVWHEDEPLASPESVAFFHLYGLAAKHVPSVLVDAGCEELLGGGGRSPGVIAGLRVVRAYNGLAPSFMHRLPDARSRYLEGCATFGATAQRGLLTDEARARGASGGPYANVGAMLEGSGAQSLLDEIMGVDIHVHLHERLTAHDKISRAAAAESRMPFVDPDLVELIAMLPARLKVRKRAARHILRRSLTDSLPVALVRGASAGVTVPISRWFRGELRPLVHECVLSDQALDRGIVRPDTVGHLVAAHESGRADHARRLWSLVNLELWQRLFLDGDAAAIQAPTVSAAAG